MSETVIVEVPTAERMEALGRRVGTALRAGDVVALDGPLGAGKTTFTRGIGEALGVRGRIASPTFVIARSHAARGEGPGLVHVDAYRLRDALELDDLDLDLERNVTVVEWGAELVAALTGSWLRISIERPRAHEGTGAGGPGAAEHAEHLPRPAATAGDSTENEENSGNGGGPDATGDEGSPDAPRRVRIDGTGARWDAAALAALA